MWFKSLPARVISVVLTGLVWGCAENGSAPAPQEVSAPVPAADSPALPPSVTLLTLEERLATWMEEKKFCSPAALEKLSAVVEELKTNERGELAAAGSLEEAWSAKSHHESVLKKIQDRLDQCGRAGGQEAITKLGLHRLQPSNLTYLGFFSGTRGCDDEDDLLAEQLLGSRLEPHADLKKRLNDYREKCGFTESSNSFAADSLVMLQKAVKGIERGGCSEQGLVFTNSLLADIEGKWRKERRDNEENFYIVTSAYLQEQLWLRKYSASCRPKAPLQWDRIKERFEKFSASGKFCSDSQALGLTRLNSDALAAQREDWKLLENERERQASAQKYEGLFNQIKSIQEGCEFEYQKMLANINLWTYKQGWEKFNSECTADSVKTIERTAKGAIDAKARDLALALRADDRRTTSRQYDALSAAYADWIAECKKLLAEPKPTPAPAPQPKPESKPEPKPAPAPAPKPVTPEPEEEVIEEEEETSAPSSRDREITVRVGSKGATVRTLKAQENGKKALVKYTSLPEGTELRVHLASVLTKQTILNSAGRLAIYEYPFFAVRIVSDKKLTEEQKAFLKTNQPYVVINELDPAKVISEYFNEELPAGAQKLSGFRWDRYNPKGTWSHYISQALRNGKNIHLLNDAPADIGDFCKNYFSLKSTQKDQFWTTLLAEISYLESSFIPFNASDESTFSHELNGVFSSGLTQLSLGGLRQACYQERGCAAIKTFDDLVDPKKHLACAIAVMSCQVSKGNCISCKSEKTGNWLGIASYWSTLRTPYEIPCKKEGCTTVAKVGKKQEIIDAIRSRLSFCK